MIDPELDDFEDITAHDVPVWKFWHPGSGLLGGLIGGCLLSAAMILLMRCL